MYIDDIYRQSYPLLTKNRDFILNELTVEIERFESTLENGLKEFKKILNDKKNEGRIDGKSAFYLYDTFGFPLELTVEMAGEEGLKVDEDGFRDAMEEQKQTARDNANFSQKNLASDIYEALDKDVTTEFTGYDRLVDDSEIAALALISDKEGENALKDTLTEGMTGAIITSQTPFYATMGGQVGDHGKIFLYPADIDAAEHDAMGCDSDDDRALAVFKVDSTEHVAGGRTAMTGHVVKGTFNRGDRVTLKVYRSGRMATCRNHSATHLLQKALQSVLGPEVEQAGSYQDAARTRFDFSYGKAMTREQIEEVEKLVNDAIARDLTVRTDVMSLEEAKKSGAMALFGEKYGESVRVVNMGDYSIELCGGTHVSHTGEIGNFKILSESGVAAGVRRIEAITGANVISYYKNIEKQAQDAAELLKSTVGNLSEHIRKLQDEMKALRNENESLKSAAARDALGSAADDAVDV
jgi:alanyl-tRNA synthetase